GLAGELVIIGGKVHPVSLTAETRQNVGRSPNDKLLAAYEPGQPLTTITTGALRRHPFNPSWKNATGYRADDELESPVGQWNKLECICDGERITVLLNGRTVMVATTNQTKGKIAFQSF